MNVIDRGRARSGIVAVLALAASLVAAGCGGSAATPPIIYITPAPPTLAPGATPTAPPPAAEIGNNLISTKAPDARWTVLYKMPVVGGASSDVVSKINGAISAKVNGYISAFTGGDLPAVTSGNTPSTLDGDFTVAVNEKGVVSLRFTILTYVSGAAHPVASAGGITFDIATGATVALGDIFTNTGDAAKVLDEKIHAALTTSLGDALSWPSSSQDISFFEKAWVVTAAGVECTWNQGDIASQAAGTPNAVVSWADLKSVLKTGSPIANLVG
jgi:hypothetical protein